MDLVAFGDSHTTGTGASIPANAFINKLAALLGGTVSNQAASGSMAMDVAWKAITLTPAPSKNYTMLVGINDQYIWGSTAFKLEAFRAFLRTVMVWSSVAAKKIARTDFTLTGSWSNTVANSLGKVTTAVGAKASTTFSGPTVYIGHTRQNHSATLGSLANVKVDGVLVGTITADGAGLTSQNGLAYSIATDMFTGFSAGSHTVEIENVGTAGKSFYLEFVADAIFTASTFFIGSILPTKAVTSPAGYASPTRIADYNGKIQELVTELSGAGLAISLVPTNGSIDPVTDTGADGIHMNDNGHQKVADEFFAAMNGPSQVSYPYFSGGNLVVDLDALGVCTNYQVVI